MLMCKAWRQGSDGTGIANYEDVSAYTSTFTLIFASRQQYQDRRGREGRRKHASQASRVIRMSSWRMAQKEL